MSLARNFKILHAVFLLERKWPLGYKSKTLSFSSQYPAELKEGFELLRIQEYLSIKLNHHFKRAQFIFTVRASDRGKSQLHADVEVELVVVDRNNKPPIWDQQNYGPIYVKENAAVGSDVTSVKARFVLGLRDLGRDHLLY